MTLSIKKVINHDTILFEDYTGEVTGYIDLDTHSCSITRPISMNFDGTAKMLTCDFKNRKEFKIYLDAHDCHFCEASKFLLNSLNIKTLA